MNRKIVLTSCNKIKIESLAEWFDNYLKSVTIYNAECNINLPAQPTENSVEYCATKRVINYKENCKDYNKSDIIFSFENYIDINEQKDYCFVVMKFNDIYITSRSFGISIPDGYVKKLVETVPKDELIDAYTKTVGNLLKEDNSKIDDKNWMFQLHNIDRKYQIKSALDNLDFKSAFDSEIPVIQDFPSKGVGFFDILQISRNPFLARKLTEYMADYYTKYFDCEIDYIVGLEARGFIFGPTLALELQCGFLCMRKAGKLPGDVVRAEYYKEYSNGKPDVFEMQNIDLTGKNILIIDDILATGGSIDCAVKLVKQLNGNVIDCCVLKAVKELREQADKKLDGIHVSVLLE
jgi:adenine phosphoribosyltransferase